MYDISKDELYEMYVKEGLSIEECADHFGCSTSPIEQRLRAFDIEVRPRGNQRLDVPQEVLHELYVEAGLTTVEIADRFDCHPSTIGRKILEQGIPTDGANHGHAIDIPESELVERYVENGETTYELGEYYGCDPSVIERRLRWYDISLRHTSAGDGTGAYKYGSNWRRQRRKALERADYSCQRCGITDAEHRGKHVDRTRGVGIGLDVHHRVSVRLFKRWALPFEDANRLSNLEVLCQSCHRNFGDRVGTLEVIEE